MVGYLLTRGALVRNRTKTQEVEFIFAYRMMNVSAAVEMEEDPLGFPTSLVSFLTVSYGDS